MERKLVINVGTTKTPGGREYKTIMATGSQRNNSGGSILNPFGANKINAQQSDPRLVRNYKRNTYRCGGTNSRKIPGARSYKKNATKAEWPKARKRSQQTARSRHQQLRPDMEIPKRLKWKTT